MTDVTDLPLYESAPPMPDGFEARYFEDGNGPGKHLIVLWDSDYSNHVDFPAKDADRCWGVALSQLLSARQVR